MVEFTGLKNPILKTPLLHIIVSESLMGWENVMVSVAAVHNSTKNEKELYCKWRRKTNKVLVTPISCKTNASWLCEATIYLHSMH